MPLQIQEEDNRASSVLKWRVSCNIHLRCGERRRELERPLQVRLGCTTPLTANPVIWFARDGVLVEASLQHEAKAIAHSLRTFFVLLKQRRRVLLPNAESERAQPKPATDRRRVSPYKCGHNRRQHEIPIHVRDFVEGWSLDSGWFSALGLESLRKSL